MKLSRILVLVTSLVVLALMFFLFKSHKQQPTKSPLPASLREALQAGQTSPTQTQATSEGAMKVNTKTFELVIKNKKLASGPETIQVTEGDHVIIKVTADENEELHLHGYDKSVDLEANKQASLEFSANLTGRFIYELEHSKTDIGALEVLPK